MSLHIHHLTGCAPEPLAGYLKGLGILRVISEQKDPGARGWWQDEHFCLMTTLDLGQLEAFFLKEYSPTPLVSPWNKGSGFFAPNDPGLSPLESSVAPRFESFREGALSARHLLTELANADAAIRALKDRTKARAGMSATEKGAARDLAQDADFRQKLAAAERRFKELKADLFTPCLLAWRGRHREWLDAALVVLDGGKVAWPSLLGTGGNDGRFDFTNNFMQRLGDLFNLADEVGAAKVAAGPLLGNSLYGTPTNDLSTAAVGQFSPGSAGGANSSTGPDGDSSVNPWDFLLMLEGTIVLRSSLVRRLDSKASIQASAPFAVRSQSTGYGTGGGDESGRGEQWLPLWPNAAVLTEVRALFGEGRLQLGRQLASRPLDVAKAITRLGVARGVSTFARYGYLERNGQSNIAVPLGRIDVLARPRGRLIDDLSPWADRLGFALADGQSPSRFKIAHRVLLDAIFAVLVHDETPGRWQAVLLAAAEIESIQTGGAGIKAGPIPSLSPGWLAATDDGSVGWRLACALGSAAAEYRQGRGRDTVRRHWLPLDRGGRRYETKEKRLAKDPRVVATGRDPVGDLIAIVSRRLIEAAREGGRRLPLVGAAGYEASPSDLAQLVAGRVDLSRVVTLARSFMAIRWDQAPDRRTVFADRWPDEAWMAIRVSSLPWPLDSGRDIPVDDDMIARLVSGDGASAVGVALRRLRSTGLRPALHAACTDRGTARLWAAALAFPISRPVARSMARRLDANA